MVEYRRFVPILLMVFSEALGCPIKQLLLGENFDSFNIKDYLSLLGLLPLNSANHEGTYET